MSKKKKNVTQPEEIESVIPTVEETIVEAEETEVLVESEIDTIKETIVEAPEEIESVIPAVIEEVIAPVSLKDAFAKHIEKTPFVIYQNGLTICRWKPNVRIELFDDTFELNGHHYKYSGVEIHHV